MQHEVARAEAVLAAFEMRLPDQVDDIDVVERADNALEESLTFFLGLARRQGGDAIEHHLVGPGLVPGEHLDGVRVDHLGNLSMPFWKSHLLVRSRRGVGRRCGSNASHALCLTFLHSSKSRRVMSEEGRKQTC